MFFAFVPPNNVYHRICQIECRANHRYVDNERVAERWQEKNDSEQAEVQKATPVSIGLAFRCSDLKYQRQKHAEAEIPYQHRDWRHQEKSETGGRAWANDIGGPDVLSS